MAYRSAPGGSGAGGSVVIITKTLHGNPNDKIYVQGGVPMKCAFGTGGGKRYRAKILFNFVSLNSIKLSVCFW